MAHFHQKTLFVNLALVLFILTYVYRLVSTRIEVFGISTRPVGANSTGCYRFGQDIPEIQGCESIQVDPRTGLAYLACGNRSARQKWLIPSKKRSAAKADPSDSVLVMDGNDNIQVLRLVELDHTGNKLVPYTQEFRVHGFDIYWDSLDPTELTFMFVNHQRTGDGISIFQHKIGTRFLRHIKTVKSPLLYAANDVVATSRSTFYATNDMRSTNKLMRMIEILFGMPWGHIVYYGHEKMLTTAASGISYPNGIARSADGNTIYVAASSEPSINIFRPRPDGSLELMGKTVFGNFVPDNISVDTATGQLLVSGFLNTFEMFRYNREALSGSTTARPASSIRRLRPLPNPSDGFAVENVLSVGSSLLPSTTMATLQNQGRGVQRILLGSVMADHIAICRTRSQPANNEAQLAR